MFKLTILLIIALFFAGQPVQADNPLPAFPGVEGAAKYVSGGRGGDVYHITNTNSSGPGSLVDGVTSADGPRTIVFDVAGEIPLDNRLRIRNDDLTIAGQTAPGGGITLRIDDNHGIDIRDCQNIIITHLRIVNGSDDNESGDMFRVVDAHNIVLSHLSIRWGANGNFVLRPDGSQTNQYFLSAEPTNRRLNGWYGQIREEEGHYRSSIRMNLGVHSGGRINMLQRGYFEFINNMTFNATPRRYETNRDQYYIYSRPWHGTADSDVGPQMVEVNVVNNVFIDGEHPPKQTYGFGQATTAYIDGNKTDRHPEKPYFPENSDDDNWDSGEDYPGDDFTRTYAPLDLGLSESQRTQPLSTRQTYIHVLSRTGTSVHRDKHDHRYVRDVMNKTKRHTELTSRPRPAPIYLDDIPGNPHPSIDPGISVVSTAGDGIPDEWKLEHGLDPEVEYHHKYTEEGYTFLEKYLHWRMRRSLPPKPGEIQHLTVSSSENNGDYAVVSATEADATENENGTMTVSRSADTSRFGLLRFNLSQIEPGMLDDAIMELATAGEDEVYEDFRVRVYGLDHDRTGQLWPGGHITAEDTPFIETSADTLRLVRDDVILLGDLEFNDGEAKLTNPNLPVFLNLAMYHQNEPESELVTLILKPVSEGETTFSVTDQNDTFEPRLNMEGISLGGFELVALPDDPETRVEQIDIISPQMMDEVSASPLFQWEAEKNASEYQLQLGSPILDMQRVLDTLVTETEFEYPGELEIGEMHQWRVRGLGRFPGQDGPWSNTISFYVEEPVSAGQEGEIPEEFLLEANYPNPFNAVTRIRFGVPEEACVALSVYNILGQRVAELVNTMKNPGWHDVTFDGSNLSSGTYLFRMSTDSYSKTRYMMLVK